MTYTISASGNYYVPPSPQHVQIPDHADRGSGLVLIWFSYSGDGGQTWSTPQYSLAVNYRIFYSGVVGSGDAIPSSECVF